MKYQLQASVRCKRTRWQIIILALLLMMARGLATAQNAQEPKTVEGYLIIGSWKMNLEKSTPSPVPRPAPGDVPSRRFASRNGEIVAFYLRDNSQGISNSGGFPIIWRGKFDGVAQPVYTQNLDSALVGGLIPTKQSRVYTAIDSHTTEIVVKMSGKVTTTVTMVVSLDGKTLTETVRGVDTKGRITSTSSLVFDKQE